MSFQAIFQDWMEQLRAIDAQISLFHQKKSAILKLLKRLEELGEAAKQVGVAPGAALPVDGEPHVSASPAAPERVVDIATKRKRKPPTPTWPASMDADGQIVWWGATVDLYVVRDLLRSQVPTVEIAERFGLPRQGAIASLLGKLGARCATKQGPGRLGLLAELPERPARQKSDISAPNSAVDTEVATAKRAEDVPSVIRFGRA